MPRYPVLQPDGKLAVWSTIVDKFLGFDYTVQQAMEWLADRYENTPESFEYECVSVAAGAVPDFMRDWAHNTAWALYLHGPDDESVRRALERTPDAMTRRYIEQFVNTCKAESRADEAVERAEAAEAQLAGVLPAAQVLVSKVEFIPILASNAAPTIDDDLTLSGLQEDTNDVLDSLDKTAIKGAINWADLRCVSTTKVHGNYGRTWFRVEIEEAAPGEETLIAAVVAGLAAKGWYTDDIEVTTEW